MPLVKVENRPHCPKIGTMQKSLRSNAIKSWIDSITVSEDSWRGTRVHIRTQDSENILVLSPQGMVDLVKALLKNISDVSIAVDEELIALVNDAKNRSDEDAAAVVACVREQRSFEKQEAKKGK